MSPLPPRDPRTTPRLELPVPGDENPPDHVTYTGELADRLDEIVPATIDEATRFSFGVFNDTGRTFTGMGSGAPQAITDPVTIHITNPAGARVVVAGSWSCYVNQAATLVDTYWRIDNAQITVENINAGYLDRVWRYYFNQPSVHQIVTAFIAILPRRVADLPPPLQSSAAFPTEKLTGTHTIDIIGWAGQGSTGLMSRDTSDHASLIAFELPAQPSQST